jgi:hypothetical protein
MTIGGTLVFCGYDVGMYSQEIFIIGTGTGKGWTTTEYLPRMTFPTNGNAGCAYVNGYLYVFGGKSDLANGGNVYIQRILLQPFAGVNIIRLFCFITDPLDK